MGKPSAVEMLFREKFADIAPAMKPEEASVEANRCLYCYDAPCITACPTHIDIPRFIKQISSKNLTGSAKTILEANAMGQTPVCIAKNQYSLTDDATRLCKPTGFRIAIKEVYGSAGAGSNPRST